MPQTPVPLEKKYGNVVDSFWGTYAVSVVSSWCAELATYPLDLIKTRLQIQGENPTTRPNNNNNGDSKLKRAKIDGHHKAYRGFVATTLGVAREEGFLKLWQGAHAALTRHLFYSGTRIVAYKHMRELCISFNNKNNGGHNSESNAHKSSDNNQQQFPLWQSVLCGLSAGAFAQFIASPADLLKVQLQMEGRRKLMGLPSRVDGLVDAFRKTVTVAGYRGLWKGSIPNVQRAALVNLGDLTTYDLSKHFILSHTTLNDSHFVHVLASICAGLSATVLGTPADVIKTRVMNQPLDEQGRGLLYKSSIDCLQKTVRNEGVGALYKGFFPIWMRLAPWSLIFWITYEEIVSLMGGKQF